MNKGRQRPFTAIVQAHFDEALASSTPIYWCEWTSSSVAPRTPRVAVPEGLLCVDAFGYHFSAEAACLWRFL
jgi:hypothetical protein